MHNRVLSYVWEEERIRGVIMEGALSCFSLYTKVLTVFNFYIKKHNNTFFILKMLS